MARGKEGESSGRQDAHAAGGGAQAAGKGALSERGRQDAHAAGGGAQAAGKGALSERGRQAVFAIVALAAIGLAAYVLFLAEPSDAPADMDAFVGSVIASPNAALFLDARGATPEEARIVFQCGVDIAGGRLFGSKTVSTYACDDSECIAANSAQNGSSALTYEQVRKSLRGVPYIQVRAGAPSTKFFAGHAEITLDGSYNQSCRLG